MALVDESPMRCILKLLVIPTGKPPGTPPEPGPEIEVEATSSDELLDAAREVVARRGNSIRAISFIPTDFVAYVEIV